MATTVVREATRARAAAPVAAAVEEAAKAAPVLAAALVAAMVVAAAAAAREVAPVCILWCHGPFCRGMPRRRIAASAPAAQISYRYARGC